MGDKGGRGIRGIYQDVCGYVPFLQGIMEVRQGSSRVMRGANIL